jgi:N-acetylneuraminic acid mutarotase
MASVEVFDPATASWSLTAPMSTACANPTATMLPDGKVLIAGGYDTASMASAELYDIAKIDKIRVSLSAAQTAALTTAKTYYLFLRESHSDGTVRTRVAGTVKVTNPPR